MREKKVTKSMGFSSQKFCTERFLFRGNIDCVFLHNNFIKNINYLPKTVNQTIFCFHIYSTSPGHCARGPRKRSMNGGKNFSVAL